MLRLLLPLFLAACTVGQDLLPGIGKPRQLTGMDIRLRVHDDALSLNRACGQPDMTPVEFAAKALTCCVVRACARVPKDRRVAGQRPWCAVHVTRDGLDALDHELRHCKGHRH